MTSTVEFFLETKQSISYLFSYAGDQPASMDQLAASVTGWGEEEQQIAQVPPYALIEDPRS